MSGEWLLEATVGAGVAFAGFVSLFLVLARRDGSFAPSDALRIRGILIMSVSAVFVPVFPGLVGALGATETDVWRISSVAFLIALAAGAGYSLRKWLEISLDERRKLGLVNDMASWLFPTSAAGLLIANVFEIFSAPSFGFYILAVWLCMGTIGTNFVAFVFRRLLTPPDA